MAKENYEEQAAYLAKAIDIAIIAFQKYPPNGFNPSHVEQMVKTYLEYKRIPEPQYKNLKSLKYRISDVFIFFQEGSGKAVDFFWTEIKKNNLPYKRENKLGKILKRGKIKNQIEYDFVIDVLVPYQQEKLMTEDEVKTVNKLIADFENKNKK